MGFNFGEVDDDRFWDGTLVHAASDGHKFRNTKVSGSAFCQIEVAHMVTMDLYEPWEGFFGDNDRLPSEVFYDRR